MSERGEKGDQGQHGQSGTQGIQGIQGIQGKPGVLPWMVRNATKAYLINLAAAIIAAASVFYTSHQTDVKLCKDNNERALVLSKILRNAQESSIRGATVRQGLSPEELEQRRVDVIKFYDEQIALLIFRDCTGGFERIPNPMASR